MDNEYKLEIWHVLLVGLITGIIIGYAWHYDLTQKNNNIYINTDNTVARKL